MPTSDGSCSVDVFRQVDVQSGLRDQPDLVNGFHIFFSGAVPQDVRRDFLFQFYVDGYGRLWHHGTDVDFIYIYTYNKSKRMKA